MTNLGHDLTPRLPPLSERFEFDESAAVEASQEVLAPLIVAVRERASGNDYDLKLWRKTGSAADLELREMWRFEMRRVERVMAHSAAQGVVVELVEFVEDEQHFGVIMEPAGRPLADLLGRLARSHWLRFLGVTQQRAKLWQNVGRLAKALGIVHAQGLIHGRVGTAAVFTEGSTEPDFRLGGFEWSIWLDGERHSGEETAALGGTSPAAAASFAEDWRDLGLMVCGLTGLLIDASGNIAPVAGRTMPHLTVGERRWLRRLCQPRPHEALVAPEVARACDEIAGEVLDLAAQRESRAMLLVLEKVVAAPVYAASGGTIAADDRAGQRAFLAQDLESGITLYVPQTTAEVPRDLYLVTERFVYRLRARVVSQFENLWFLSVVGSVGK